MSILIYIEFRLDIDELCFSKYVYVVRHSVNLDHYVSG